MSVVDRIGNDSTNIRAIAFASLTAAILLTAFSASLAQSGGARLHGWVAFEDVAYVDMRPRAKVVLQHDPPGSGPAYSTETDEHGFFEFPHTSLGRFKLEITATGFQPYSADVYVPSDFAGNWAGRSKPKRRRALDRACTTTDHGRRTTDHRFTIPSCFR